MKLHGGACVALLWGVATLHAAENVSAVDLARQADARFQQGDFKKARKLWERAVSLDTTNAVYRASLGETYEREAEQASFPLVLTGKARASFVRALQLEPENRAALEGLIDLQQQPIGLCEGDLNAASRLIGRLDQIDHQAATRKQRYWNDATREQSQPGQRLLCGPVKVSRVITDHFVPPASMRNAGAAPTKAGDVAVAQSVPTQPAVQAGQ